VSSWFFLTGVAVAAPQAASAIVALGDSITDGANSTADANRRWPDVLAARLRAAGKPLSVLNAGIGGNRILHDGRGGFRTLFGVSALARFDSDVLAQPGVRRVIVLLGINDIGHTGSSEVPASEEVSPEDIVAGLRQLVERAHTHGLRFVGGTMTPFEGTGDGYYTEAKEAKRQAVNDWIRRSRAFDGVIDFDRAVQDPEHPARFLPAFDSGDHLHPGDAGLEAMGKAVDLSLFDDAK
jgi:lysophospholipase L1-like esterase